MTVPAPAGADHSPGCAVNVAPILALPLIVGGTVFAGALCVVIVALNAVTLFPDASSTLSFTVCVPSLNAAVFSVTAPLVVFAHGSGPANERVPSVVCPRLEQAPPFALSISAA